MKRHNSTLLYSDVKWTSLSRSDGHTTIYYAIHMHRSFERHLSVDIYQYQYHMNLLHNKFSVNDFRYDFVVLMSITQKRRLIMNYGERTRCQSANHEQILHCKSKNHLINANSICCGSWILEVNQITQKLQQKMKQQKWRNDYFQYSETESNSSIYQFDFSCSNEWINKTQNLIFNK